MGGEGTKKEGREREADDGGSVGLSHFPHLPAIAFIHFLLGGQRFAIRDGSVRGP